MRKVVLLIVEGISEEIALAMPLRRLFAIQPSGETIEFQVVSGDITTNKGTTVSNIKEQLNRIVKEFLGKNKFRAKDLLEIVLLADTDGAYITDDAIKEDVTYLKPSYTDSCILCKDKAAIIERNQQKRRILDLLIPLRELQGIPFSVYYFSCNLDSVLHNEANLEDRQKTKKAEKFEQEYGENPSGLLRFFSNSAAITGTTYEESWAYIKERNHSLQQSTNFHVFLSMQAKSFPRDFSQLLANE